MSHFSSADDDYDYSVHQSRVCVFVFVFVFVCACVCFCARACVSVCVETFAGHALHTIDMSHQATNSLLTFNSGVQRCCGCDSKGFKTQRDAYVRYCR